MSYSPLAPEQSEYLLRVIETAPQVCRRHQFFVWSQGDLQRWLPHKLMACGAYDRDQREVLFDVFNSLPLPEDVVAEFRYAGSALMQHAVLAWRRARHQPCRIDLPDNDAGAGYVDRLRTLGYEQLLVHGLHRPGRPEELESFFVFAHPQHRYADEAVAAFDMLLSCVHLTYQRVCSTERQVVPGRANGLGAAGVPYQRPPSITEREREILVWVRDGLNNQQIAAKLGISALTVKNHIQKILRKLGAANRAQAVAKAMSMNAMSGPSGMDSTY